MAIYANLFNFMFGAIILIFEAVFTDLMSVFRNPVASKWHTDPPLLTFLAIDATCTWFLENSLSLHGSAICKKCCPNRASPSSINGLKTLVTISEFRIKSIVRLYDLLLYPNLTLKSTN
ncbi:hypothetical protein GQX74_012760 [Glossina fuscipes]|nr:hypothetical protein GQX74_012760 [Glossina fuscipes]